MRYINLRFTYLLTYLQCTEDTAFGRTVLSVMKLAVRWLIFWQKTWPGY